MINLVIYNKQSLLSQLNFIEKKKLKTIIVTPNPVLADYYRSFFDGEVLSYTINAYLNEHLLKQIPEDQEEEFDNQKPLKKSEMIKIFATAWKKFSDKKIGFDEFVKSFNLFTEIRSFTLDKNIFLESMNFLEEKRSSILKVFWEVIEHLNLVDEQKSYEIFAKKLRKNISLGEKENVIFIDFPFIGASQLELIKAIGIFHDVYIPYKKILFDSKKSSDWVSWINEDNLIDISEEFNDKVNSKLILYNKNDFFKKFKKSIGGKTNKIMLVGKNLSVEDYLEIPGSDWFFKVPYKLVDIIKKQISKDLAFSCRNGDRLELIIEWLIAEEKIAAKEKKYLKIRVIQDFIKVINSWMDLSKDNIYYDNFFLELLNHIVGLDEKRIFQTSLKNSDKKILEFDNPVSVGDTGVALIANSRYSNFELNDSKYTEELVEFYGAIGPMLNGHHFVLLAEHKVVEILYQNGGTLFLESTLQETSVFWKNIIKELSPEKIEIKRVKKDLSNISLFEKFEAEKTYGKSLSYSRMQDYIDCPLKFKHKFIDDFRVNIELKSRLQSNQVGLISHKVIERVLISPTEIDLKLEIKKVLNKFLQDIGILLSENENQYWQKEIHHYVSQISQIILNLKKNGAEVFPEYHFERMVNKTKVSGEIDLLIKYDNQIAIFDFKLSKGAVPTKGEVLDFKKIQSWTYLNSINEKLNISMFGYIVLDSLSDSMIFKNNSSDNSFFDKYFTFGKNYKLDVNEYLDKFQAIEETIVSELTSRNSFPPKPMNEAVCTYCDLKTVCDKGMINGA